MVIHISDHDILAVTSHNYCFHSESSHYGMGVMGQMRLENLSFVD